MAVTAPTVSDNKVYNTDNKKEKGQSSIKRRNLYEARKEEFDRRETLQISL